MPLHFDLFWSFRSPYSYLAAPKLLQLTREYDLICHFRAVYPLAVRVEGFFETVNPMWPGYLIQDVPREAERLGLPIHWPDPDPIVQDFATMKVADEQPYITRLTRLGAAAERSGKGLAFATAVSARLWGGVKNWHEGDVLAEAAKEAGLNMDDLEGALAEDAAGLDKEIEQNESDQTKAGHWGVPLMAFEGEPFFGQDRIDTLVWRLQQKGLKAR
ncbi:MAG: disulfide bond formation protein DsbA [Robiginitomaculum sp.]|nr:MAG: disulfide bond formation protein DsbA [Robiginitomaculum sp.]